MLATNWLGRLQAPSKKLVWFDNAAHMMQVEAPGKTLVHLVEDARPLAARVGDVAPVDAAPAPNTQR